MFTKKKNIFICAFALVLAGLWTFRYITLNQKYPQPDCETYSISQPVLLEPFEILVSDFYFLDPETTKEALALEFETGYDAKCAMLDLSITNKGDTVEKIEAGAFQLQSDSWRNSVNFIVYRNVNSAVKDGALNLELEPGETCQIKLPFSMVDLHFFSNDWENVENRPFDLVLSLYPIKRIISLQ